MRWIIFVALLGIWSAQEFPTSRGTFSFFDPNSPEHQLGKPKVHQTGNILIYSSSPEVLLTFSRLENLGYTINVMSDVSMLLTDTLCTYDFLYIDIPYDPSLNNYASIIQDYLSRGGGLVLAQTNLLGPVPILPQGLEIDVIDTMWPEWPNQPGPATLLMDHPITDGLSGDDLPGNFETVPLSDVGESWDVIAVDEDHPNLVLLLAARYGAGKIVYFTGNIALNSIQKGSNEFLVKMVEWVSSDGCNPTSSEEGQRFISSRPVISPNPIKNSLRVSMTTDRNSPVEFVIYDPNGRKVFGITKILPLGPQEINIDLNQGGLAPTPRVLFLEITQGEKHWHIPFLFLK